MPSEQAGDEACDRASEHNAEQQAAHHVAHDAPPLLFGSQVRGVRHKNLGDHGADSDNQRSRQEQRCIRCEGSRHQCDDQNKEKYGDQTAIFGNVAKRHDKKQSKDVPDLGNGDDQSGCGRR
ncbi:hypothetical protein D1872_280590 [compost metagenome]